MAVSGPKPNGKDAIVLLIGVAVAAALALLIVASAVGPRHPGSRGWYENSLSIQVFHTSGGSFQAVIPVPITLEGLLSPLVEDLLVKEGDATFRIEASQYGTALRVEGKGKVVLGALRNDPARIVDRFSMEIEEKPHSSTNRINGTWSGSGELVVSITAWSSEVCYTLSLVLNTVLRDQGWSNVQSSRSSTVC